VLLIGRCLAIPVIQGCTTCPTARRLRPPCGRRAAAWRRTLPKLLLVAHADLQTPHSATDVVTLSSCRPPIGQRPNIPDGRCHYGRVHILGPAEIGQCVCAESVNIDTGRRCQPAERRAPPRRGGTERRRSSRSGGSDCPAVEPMKPMEGARVAKRMESRDARAGRGRERRRFEPHGGGQRGADNHSSASLWCHCSGRDSAWVARVDRGDDGRPRVDWAWAHSEDGEGVLSQTTATTHPPAFARPHPPPGKSICPKQYGDAVVSHWSSHPPSCQIAPGDVSRARLITLHLAQAVQAPSSC